MDTPNVSTFAFLVCRTLTWSRCCTRPTTRGRRNCFM